MVEKSRRKIIRGAFLRLMINNMLLIIALCCCGLIDNIFVGRRLGESALAAMGFFSPVSVGISISYVLIMGTLMLTGNLVGAGETKKVNRLFLSSFLILTGFYAVFSILCIVFDGGLSTLLGAKGEAHEQLCAYIKGYLPGVVPQVLTALFMALCSFNNDIKRSYVAIAAMIVSNVLGDVFLIGPLGLFGIGLASSIGSLVSFLVLLTGFFNKDKLFHFGLGYGFDMRLILKALLRGLPSLMLSFGVLIRNYCYNFALNEYTGAAGVAVAGIMMTVSSLTAAVPACSTNAYSTLAGIYYGEGDRESLIDLTHIALRIGIVTCLATTGLIMALSSPLSRLFFPHDEVDQELAVRMFLLGFTFLVPNVFYNLFLQAYRAQGKMALINVLSFAETASMGLFVFITVRFFGADAAWLANTIIDVGCIVVVLVSIFVYQRKVTFAIPSMLKLSPEFGVDEEDCLTYSVSTLEEVTTASVMARDFCLRHKCNNQTAYRVRLCLEEIAGNVLEHGFQNNKHRHADIRVVIKKGELTIRVRDDCREFDPRKRIDLFDPDNPEKDMGIRLVAKTASEIDYYNNAGINTLIMKFQS